MTPKDRGTVGLIQWILEPGLTCRRQRGQRKRRALQIIAARALQPQEAQLRFKRALANADINKAHKEWALL